MCKIVLIICCIYIEDNDKNDKNDKINSLILIKRLKH